MYDLAFLAAGDAKTKAIIADSLKSRPSLKWNILEELAKGDEWIKTLYEAEAANLAGGYIINFTDLNREFEAYKKKIKKDLSGKRKSLHIEAVPEGWSVVHFYLNQLERQGYALIYNSDKKEWTQPEPFKYDELFNAYIEWQGNYNLSRRKEDSAEHLVSLCRKIGETMPFLFNTGLITDKKALVFVPHDFLHRLPLHAAIIRNGDNDNIFMFNHPCCYLPAWDYSNKNETTKNCEKYLVINQSDFKAFDKSKYSNVYDNFDAIPSLSEPPEYLDVTCHGKADVINPFNSRLVLDKKDETYLNLLSRGNIFINSKIALGACETDLSPALSNAIDEHLSIATAFLSCGASEVLATMWEIAPDKADEIKKQIQNGVKNPMMCTLWDYINRNKDSISPEATTEYYHFMPFRIIGMPDFQNTPAGS